MNAIFTVVLTILFLTLSSTIGFSQEQPTPEAVVQENLDFYNKRDIDGFMRSFSDSISLHSFGNTQLPIIGKGAIRALYENLFNESPQLHSTIIHRTVLGNKVIDHESIVGRRGSDTPIEIILIYEVADGKIFRMTAIRE
jgi:hypothetical protein